MNTKVPFLYIIGTVTFVVFVVFLVLIIIEYRKRQLRHLTEQLQLKHEYQHELLRTQLEVQEQSFKYISEEIHDNIAQILSLAKLKLYKTAEKTNDEAVKANLEVGTELVGNALNGLRNLSHVLNGGLVSRLSLQESIEKELNYISDVKDIKTNLSVSGTTNDLGAEKKLIAFRIVQEAINNALKHGAANEINIRLHYEQANLKIEIADNGKGFDTKETENSKGLGLYNMQIRAKMLGGLHIQSEKDKGTIIMLNIHIHD